MLGEFLTSGYLECAMQKPWSLQLTKKLCFIGATKGIETGNNIWLGFERKSFLYHVLFTKNYCPICMKVLFKMGAKDR